jgi:hypothetical protein
VLAARLAAGDTAAKLSGMHLPGLTLFETARDRGLCRLRRLDAAPPDEERLVSRFWQAFFGARLGSWDDAQTAVAWQGMADSAPEAAQALMAHIPEMGRQFKHGLRTGALLDDTFWAASPGVVRPLTGFAQMSLANGSYSRRAWADVMEMLEALIAVSR